MSNKTFIVRMVMEIDAEYPTSAVVLARQIVKAGADVSDDPRNPSQFVVANVVEVVERAALPSHEPVIFPVDSVVPSEVPIEDELYKGFKALAPTFAETSPFLFEQFIKDHIAKRKQDSEDGAVVPYTIAYGVEDLVEMEMLLVQARKK